MLRQVHLPEIPGALFLYRMPGRCAPFEQDSAMIHEHKIDYVISLASLEEIEAKSPDYAQAVRANSLAWPRVEFPVPDYKAPDQADMSRFLDLVKQAAADLNKDKRIMIHCGAGIGRTGMVATCVLLALGLDKSTALSRVCEARSGPERPCQEQWIADVAAQLAAGVG